MHSHTGGATDATAKSIAMANASAGDAVSGIDPKWVATHLVREGGALVPKAKVVTPPWRQHRQRQGDPITDEIVSLLAARRGSTAKGPAFVGDRRGRVSFVHEPPAFVGDRRGLISSVPPEPKPTAPTLPGAYINATGPMPLTPSDSPGSPVGEVAEQSTAAAEDVEEEGSVAEQNFAAVADVEEEGSVESLAMADVEERDGVAAVAAVKEECVEMAFVNEEVGGATEMAIVKEEVGVAAPSGGKSVTKIKRKKRKRDDDEPTESVEWDPYLEEPDDVGIETVVEQIVDE